MIGNHAVMEMAAIILNVNLFVRPMLVGLAGVLFLLWGIVTDPLVRHISDNSRFRSGRHRPFIIWGIALCSLFFPLIWMRKEWSELGIFSWFLLGSLVFYTALFYSFRCPACTGAYRCFPHQWTMFRFFDQGKVRAGRLGAKKDAA